jgi:hypothetical protein
MAFMYIGLRLKATTLKVFSYAMVIQKARTPPVIYKRDLQGFLFIKGGKSVSKEQDSSVC